MKSTASPPLKNGVMKLHEIIQGFMKEHRLEPDSLYQQIDSNRSGMVSYEEFSGWIRRISSERLEKEVIN